MVSTVVGLARGLPSTVVKATLLKQLDRPTQPTWLLTMLQEHAHRLKLLKYEPLKVQQQQAALEGTAAAADEASLAEQQGLNEAVTALLHVLLGARFVSGQAAMYAAYIATDNLLASFMTGMLAQMYHTACCRRIQGRR